MLINLGASMNYDLSLLEKLLKDKQVEIQDGVLICCEQQLIHLDIYLKNDNIVIEFAAPFTYLLVKKIGVKRLLNLVKPRIESITITPKSYIIKLSTIGDYEIER